MRSRHLQGRAGIDAVLKLRGWQVRTNLGGVGVSELHCEYIFERYREQQPVLELYCQLTV